MTRWLNLIGWLVCVVYASIPCFWLLVHPRAAYWRSRRASPYRTLLSLWMGMWIALGLVSFPWRRLTFYVAPWTWAPAILLLILGVRIYSQSGKNFSLTQLGGLPEVLPQHGEQRLVTTGIRSRVRHPIYLGHLCELLAWCLGTGLLVCYGLMLFAIVTGTAMIRLEDRELEQRFGEQYREYRRRVPAILPRI